MKSKTFQDVEVWRKAQDWVLKIYAFSGRFPFDERFGLTSQLRRAAVSVPANFAEGFKKLGLADKVRFYNIAQASLEECPLLANSRTRFRLRGLVRSYGCLDEVGSMLKGYSRAIRRSY